MELGQKLKEARLEAGLSQRQLCGRQITRNMLSLIENGSAKPSMDTLRYLAQTLHKPLAYFLDETVVTSANQPVMEKARQAYSAQDFQQCLARLESYQPGDDTFDWEYHLLTALCSLALARVALNEGKTAYAVNLLDSASDAASQTPYATSQLHRQWLLLAYEAGLQPSRELASQLPDNTAELLLRAQAALDDGNASRCLSLLDSATPCPAFHLLTAQGCIALNDFSRAISHLLELEIACPEKAYPLLELCYRQQNNFEKAYEYACKQRL